MKEIRKNVVMLSEKEYNESLKEGQNVEYLACIGSTGRKKKGLRSVQIRLPWNISKKNG